MKDQDKNKIIEHLTKDVAKLRQQISELTQKKSMYKQLKRASQESEERYHTLFEYAVDAIFFESDKEEIVEVNQRACDMFGYSRDELMKMKTSQLYLASDSGHSIYSNPALGSEVPIEMTGVHKNGSKLSLEYTITPLISGKQTVFMLIIRDITDRKMAEKALQESEEKYRTILENIEDGYYEIDTDTNFTFYNDALIRILESSEEEVLEESIWKFIDKGNSESMDQDFDEILETENPIKGIEWQVLTKTGDQKYVESSLSLMKNMDGNIIGFRGILRDVTKRKLAESELKFAQDHLVQSEKMAALGELVAGVAHEINTPIGIGVTGMSALEERTNDIETIYTSDDLTQDEFESYIKTVSEASATVLSNLHRAAEMVRTFKQVAADQSSERKRKFKVKDYINDIIFSMRPRLKSTQHVIRVNCPDDLEMETYPGAFSRIVTNLLMNSAKLFLSSSLIHGFENIQKGKILFDIETEEDGILFQYSDDGKGIEQDILAKIFDPFFTTKRGQGGTGLGMHIVYNLVTQTFNGMIECKSKPGKGTRFLIRIPFEKKAENDHAK